MLAIGFGGSQNSVVHLEKAIRMAKNEDALEELIVDAARALNRVDQIVIEPDTEG